MIQIEKDQAKAILKSLNRYDSVLRNRRNELATLYGGASIIAEIDAEIAELARQMDAITGAIFLPALKEIRHD